MPVPTLVTDLSTTLASNSPAGSDNVFPDLDNYLRALSGFVASIRDNSGNGWVSPYLPLAGGTVTGATTFSSTVALNGALSGTGLTTYLASPPAIGGTAPAAGSFTTLSASGNVNVPSLNSGQLAGMRNKIINGKMDISQRGTSFAAIPSGDYSLDRWVWNAVTTGVVTISQQTDVPSSNEFQNSLRIAVTTADTSIAAGDAALIIQRIEGFNVRDLIGKTFTLSFWVRSSKTGTHCVSFRNNAAGTPDRSYVVEYTVSAANTWEYKSVTVSGGLITAGTWNWTNGAGLGVGWALAAGSTFQTTAGAWQTGNFFATANQVNCLDTVGNIFAITGVQLEPGSVATPFEHRPIGLEDLLSKRYFQRLTGAMSVGGYGAGSNAWTTFTFPVTMRASPTSTLANFTNVNCGNAIQNQINANLIRTQITSTAAGVAYSIADIDLSAEL